MQNAVTLANNKQKRKREAKRSFIATEAALTAAEAIKLLEIADNELEGGGEVESSQSKKCALSKIVYVNQKSI